MSISAPVCRLGVLLLFWCFVSHTVLTAQLVCPDPAPIDGCLGQAAIDQAFQDWANSFPGSTSGACDPVITYTVNGTGSYAQAQLAAAVAAVTPDVCIGGAVVIECTAVDTCAVPPPYCDEPIPGQMGYPADPACEAQVCAIDPFCCDTEWDAICAGEAAVLAECCGCVTPFNPISCVPAIETCVSIFEVIPAVAPLLECPAPVLMDGCVDQGIINAAFADWATSFSSGGGSGSCVPTVTYAVNGSGTLTQSELVNLLLSSVPSLCTGGAYDVLCTAIDICGGTQTCGSAFQVIPPAPLGPVDCPAPETVDGCIGQFAVDAAFDSWISSFNSSVTGGCAPVITYTVNGSGTYSFSELFTVASAPDVCSGGTVSIECTVDDMCGTATCASSFLVIPADAVPQPACPGSLNFDGCLDQLLIDLAFVNWINGFSSNATGGCDPVLTYALNGSGSLTYIELLNLASAPQQCVGGEVVVTCTVEDVCGSSTCSSTFLVTPAPLLEEPVCPAPVVLECADQATIDAALASWAAAFATSATGGCAPAITYSVNGSGSFSPGDLASVLTPPLSCSGGTISVICIVADVCQILGCESVFTVIPDDVGPEVFCPDDLFIGCSDPVPPPDVASVLALDNCTAPPDIVIAHVGDFAFGAGCSEVIERVYSATDDCGNVSFCTQLIIRTPGIDVISTVWLEGALNAGTTGMDADLNGILPLAHPYGAPPFNHPGTENVPFFSPDVVDWILCELRQPATDAVLFSRAALLLDDGQIVDLDGVSPVHFNAPPDFYTLAIRHRNHLDIKSLVPLDFTSGAGGCDFTTVCVSPAGMLEVLPGVFVMYAGDVNGDHLILYNNALNDKNEILGAVGLSTPNNVVAGYHFEDVNMDGEVRYNNAFNDKNEILDNVGLSTPNNLIQGLLF